MNTIIDKINIWTTAQELKTSNRGRSAGNQSLLGIKKLRELILELAVRGKLVPQDPNDESASVLLKKIEKEKQQLIKKGEIRKSKVLSEIADDEIPFDLPKGWIFTRLNNLGDWGAGATPNRSRHEYYGGNIPWFKSGELNRDYISISEEFVTDLALKETSLRYNKVGDVLIAMYGATIGKTSILEIPATTNQAVCACTPFVRIFNVFLLTLLKAYKSRFIGMGAGGAQPNISREKLIATVIALPPLAEQHRIVAKVDELMALCDELENQQTSSNAAHETLVATLLGSLTDAGNASSFDESWQRIAMHLDTLFTTEHSIDQLKQTILQLAVMGKLTQQNPNDEPASELLKKIAKEKSRLVKEGKIKKQAPLPEITDDEKPFGLPNSWAWVAWGNLLAYDDGAFKRGPFGSSLKKDMFVNSGYKVYEQYCPINDDCSFERYYITNEMYENLKTFAVKANDYLISCSGATLGRITQIPEDFKEGIINQALLRVRINHEYLDGTFFKLLFRSPFFQKMILDNSTGSAIPNVKGVNELKSMPIPFSPLAEQHRIVAKVDELFALCDALKERLVEAQTLQNQLAVAVVEQALN